MFINQRGMYVGDVENVYKFVQKCVYMENIVGRNEDDVEHAKEDFDDQEIRDDHDNEAEHAISHDHEGDPTIGDDGDVDVDN